MIDTKLLLELTHAHALSDLEEDGSIGPTVIAQMRDGSRRMLYPEWRNPAEFQNAVRGLTALFIEWDVVSYGLAMEVETTTWLDPVTEVRQDLDVPEDVIVLFAFGEDARYCRTLRLKKSEDAVEIVEAQDYPSSYAHFDTVTEMLPSDATTNPFPSGHEAYIIDTGYLDLTPQRMH